MKRILIATLFGLLFGIICFLMASSNGEMPWSVSLHILINRTLIGFVIGVSSLHLKHWSLHGIIMGFVFSLPLAFSGLMAPESPEYSLQSIFIATLVMGVIYGFLIELFTTVVFKAKQK